MDLSTGYSGEFPAKSLPDFDQIIVFVHCQSLLLGLDLTQRLI